jgi:hypothetical protein
MAFTSGRAGDKLRKTASHPIRVELIQVHLIWGSSHRMIQVPGAIYWTSIAVHTVFERFIGWKKNETGDTERYQGHDGGAARLLGSHYASWKDR